jgi:hypothetical protein
LNASRTRPRPAVTGVLAWRGVWGVWDGAVPAVGGSEVSVSEAEVEAALAEFAERLIASQRELPPEAAAVLYANLWDLYE